MKRYFVCSDIHSFFDEWMSSLSDAGFDINNDDHILIVLGDIFDRGPKPWETYQFIKSIPLSRRILIKGNHEYLLNVLVNRKYAEAHDYSNRTYETLILLYKNPNKVQESYIFKHHDEFKDNVTELYIRANEVYEKARKKLFNNKKINEIIEWINSPEWLPYYELGKYIFVHSFIPLEVVDPYLGTVKYNPNWRTNSKSVDFEEATWGCPYRLFLAGLFDEEIKKGKILVSGHWHTSDYYNHLLYPNEKELWLDIHVSNPIFKSPLFPNIIGIDACTALTHKVNILIIEESFIE